jgi:hypothetical protein
MNMKTSIWARRAGFVAAVLVAGSAVASEGPRYTYGELGYAQIDFDGFNEDADVFGADGSLAVSDRVFLIASYSQGTIDASGFDVDLTTAAVGAGMHFPLNETIDFVADAAYVWAEVDADSFDAQDDDGFALSAGLRAMLTPQFELNGGGTYVDVSDDDTALYVGAVYNFTDMFAVTGNVSVGDNATAYGVGARLYFDVR